MDKFDLQRLRDLPIEGVAERLGLSVRQHKALCPFHDDHHASLSFSARRNTFRCFACGASGGTIDLAMRRLGLPFLDACRWLQPLSFPPGGKDAVRMGLPPLGEGRGGAGAATFDASRYERFFEHPWLSPEARRFLFDERHLDERMVRWCRLTSWRDRQGVDWLQIPYYDREGRLTGLQNRNLGADARPRFRFPPGAVCGIYNLPVLQRLARGDELYLAEGSSDCWALLSAGHKAIAIPSATLLRRDDAEMLRSLADSLSLSLHMYPDRDAPGERLFRQLREALPTLRHHQLPPGCKDYGEYYLRRGS